MDQPRVLIVDDEREILSLLGDLLGTWGYDVSTAASAAQALDLMGERLFDAALLDISMPGMDGLELLTEIKRRDLGIDVVMMTGRPTVDTAVKALKAGAYDYLEKPLNFEELRHLLGRVTERQFLHREVAALRTRLGEQLPGKELVTGSPQMKQVLELIDRVAPTDSPILIEGESGTGKELVASAIHRRSSRSGGPFIPVNCGAIPGELMESQFFGHVRGAFSGAVADALGLFRSAHGGTLFLDEVAELPAPLQVKFLRVLQDGEVRPVGSAKSSRVDVRVVAATNRELAQAVKDGSFRQDLFYRLNVVRIVIPPLRERRADIPVLVTHFLRKLNQRFHRDVRGTSPAVMAALMAYDFPGNVRELENLLERAYAMGACEEITEVDLPASEPGAKPAPAGEAATQVPTLAQAERDLIVRALRVFDNDKEGVARALGVSRRTLYRRLKDYGL